MKARELYRKILKTARSKAPMHERQQNRLWLSYHAKELIKHNKSSSKDMFDKALFNLYLIEKYWNNSARSGVFERKERKYKVDDNTYKGWLPGFATRKWLKNLQK